MTQFLIYFFNISFLGLLVIIVYRSCTNPFVERMFFPLFGVKVLSALSLALVYTFYYGGGDTIEYYEGAKKVLYLDFKTYWNWLLTSPDPSEEVRKIFFVKLTSLVLFVTRADYWLITLYMATISFFVSVYFLGSIQSKKVVILLAFCLVPSILFWTSGLLKETMAYSSLLILVSAWLRQLSNKRLHVGDYFLLAFSLFLLINLKYYIAVVLLPALLFLSLNKKLTDLGWIQANWIRIALLILVICIPTYLIFNNWFPHVSWSSMNNLLRQGPAILDVGPMEVLDQGGHIELLQWPVAIFTGLFRPLVVEKMSPLGVFAGIENLILLSLLLWKLMKIKGSILSINGIHVVAALYVIVLAFLMGMSVTNMGTLSRLRVYYLPLIWFWVLDDHPLFKLKNINRQLRDFS